MWGWRILLLYALPTVWDNQLELKVEWFSQVFITYQLYQPMVQAIGNQLVDGLIILSGIELENLSSNEPNAFCTKQKKGNSSASGITRRSVIWFPWSIHPEKQKNAEGTYGSAIENRSKTIQNLWWICVAGYAWRIPTRTCFTATWFTVYVVDPQAKRPSYLAAHEIVTLHFANSNRYQLIPIDHERLPFRNSTILNIFTASSPDLGHSHMVASRRGTHRWHAMNRSNARLNARRAGRSAPDPQANTPASRWLSMGKSLGKSMGKSHPKKKRWINEVNGCKWAKTWRKAVGIAE